MEENKPYVIDSGSGYTDVNGNFVNESYEAKLRNALGPCWTLIDVLKRYSLKELNDKPEIYEIFKSVLIQSDLNRKPIIEIIERIEDGRR